MIEYFHDKQEERKTMQTWHKELNFDNTDTLTMLYLQRILYFLILKPPDFLRQILLYT